jgi:hypothetical protein
VLGNLLKISGLIAIAAIGGGFFAPPLSCRRIPPVTAAYRSGVEPAL